MKAFSIALFRALVISGCASQRTLNSQKDLLARRDEVEVLQDELDVVTRQWNRVQEELRSKDLYTANDQIRDLDQCRSILLEARNKMMAETKRLHDKYGIDDGPY